ncbi:MAG: hypothetical protein Q7K55_05865 [Candidatus Levybacteria bacterium]|nr:hypothetical protein [Candidatus Levybacteria bacterium]
MLEICRSTNYHFTIGYVKIIAVELLSKAHVQAERFGKLWSREKTPLVETKEGYKLQGYAIAVVTFNQPLVISKWRKGKDIIFQYEQFLTFNYKSVRDGETGPIGEYKVSSPTDLDTKLRILKKERIFFKKLPKKEQEEIRSFYNREIDEKEDQFLNIPDQPSKMQKFWNMLTQEKLEREYSSSLANPVKEIDILNLLHPLDSSSALSQHLLSFRKPKTNTEEPEEHDECNDDLFQKETMFILERLQKLVDKKFSRNFGMDTSIYEAVLLLRKNYPPNIRARLIKEHFTEILQEKIKMGYMRSISLSANIRDSKMTNPAAFTYEVGDTVKITLAKKASRENIIIEIPLGINEENVTKAKLSIMDLSSSASYRNEELEGIDKKGWLYRTRIGFYKGARYIQEYRYIDPHTINKSFLAAAQKMILELTNPVNKITYS